MSNRITATGVEALLIKTWAGWEGDGLDWMFFYDCELRPEILEDCVAKGWSPDHQFDVELNINALTAQVIVVVGGEETTVKEYKLAVTIESKK